MNEQKAEKPGLLMRGMIWLMPKLTPYHVWMYRKLKGRFVNKATAGMPVVLVTAVGRHSGQPRTVVLGHMMDGEDVIVAGTNGGKTKLPGWIYNLRANSAVKVELGAKSFSAQAEFLEGPEWQNHWDRLVTIYPAYEQAQRFAGRKIPLVRLRRVANKEK